MKCLRGILKRLATGCMAVTMILTSTSSVSAATYSVEDVIVGQLDENLYVYGGFS